MLTPYSAQHLETLSRLQEAFEALGEADAASLREITAPYLSYRGDAARFFREHLLGGCSRLCFEKERSGCCGRDGIIVFFADFVVELLTAGAAMGRELAAVLAADRGGRDCVYLGPAGCAWSLKPIACEMFLCDEVKAAALAGDERIAGQWQQLREREKEFTRPDRPVLFDDLERFFIDREVADPLMYFHHSPGLLQLKRRHGVGRLDPLELP